MSHDAVGDREVREWRVVDVDAEGEQEVPTGKKAEAGYTTTGLLKRGGVQPISLLRVIGGVL